MTTDLEFDYWSAFDEYAQLERAAGGPDPQIKIIGEALKQFTPAAAARGAGMFVNCYTVAGAAALWNRGRTPLTVEWLDQHGMGVGTKPIGLPMRRERRAVYGAAKFVAAHESWAYWAYHELPKLEHAPYLEVYASIDKHVLFFGRYAAMKVLEVLHYRGLIANGQSDIRPKDAKFPRRTLAKLFPDHREMLLSKDQSPDTLALCNKMGAVIQERVGGSYYEIETLLCTFRQCLTGKYPGRSQDRELSFWRQADSYWQSIDPTWDALLPFYEIRSELFAAEHLGEKGSPPWYTNRDGELKWEARYPSGVAY